MGTAPSKESIVSRQIDQNLKRAADQPIRLLCLGDEPLPPVSSTLTCQFIQLPQPKTRKWMQSLAACSSDHTHAIVFTVPLIWYEQTCDCSKQNKLQQAMEYFRCIRKHFCNLSILVILTERPEFTARIRAGDVDMDDHFPNYQGAPEDPNAALAFVRNEFKRLFYEARACDDWATLYILYDDGCKRLRSAFIAKAINAIQKTDCFAHINDMLTPDVRVPSASSSSTTKLSLKSKQQRRRQEARTVRISSDESCSESTHRI